MAFRIGFSAQQPENKFNDIECTEQQAQPVPRKSVVQVYFEGRNMNLAYYNDKFDLHRGDIVYVDGKLEGMRGRVTDVNYNFKIRLSDYKRVVAVVDTTVHGKFCMAGSHFVTFDRGALPKEKAVLWFKAPMEESDDFVSGSDNSTFCLENFKGVDFSPSVSQRGHEYYMESRVRYICIDGTCGYAIVEGSQAYEVEFEYQNGAISRMTCSCFCSYNCKHEFAVMLQLRETLELITKNYPEEYNRTGYFAAINKGTLFAFAVDGRETGGFIL